MSQDEIILMIVCLLCSIFSWSRWYYLSLTVVHLGTSARLRLAFWLLPLLCGVVLWVVLCKLASEDVRHSYQYLGFFTLMGLAWIGAGAEFMTLLGLSYRDDVLERRNPAAAWAVAGSLVGLTLAFAGGNIGNGPGWWAVAYCGLLSTAAFVSLLVCLEIATGITELVTVDRDRAAGLRLGGFLSAEGLLLGRAVAGDWESFSRTHVDFLKLAWPGVVLFLVATLGEKVCRLRVERPAPPVVGCGLIPSLAYWALAIGWLGLVGLRP